MRLNGQEKARGVRMSRQCLPCCETTRGMGDQSWRRAAAVAELERSLFTTAYRESFAVMHTVSIQGENAAHDG